MNIASVDSYVSYFRYLAVADTDLQHNPLGETGDAPPGSLHFTRWSAEEALTGLRTKIAFPALLLELYETDTKSETAFDVKGIYSGAFTVVQSAKQGSFTSEIEAFKLTEKIAIDILNQIWLDHYGPDVDRCTAPFEYFDFDKLNITPVGPILNNEFGYRVLFSFKLTDDNKFNGTIAPFPANDWLQRQYYTKDEVDALITAAFAGIDLSNYYTKAEVDVMISHASSQTAIFSFSNASSVTCAHNFGKSVMVQVNNSNGDQVFAQIKKIDLNTVQINFNQIASGEVIIKP